MIESEVDIATKSGSVDTFICHPERYGPYPAIIIYYMDTPAMSENGSEID